MSTASGPLPALEAEDLQILDARGCLTAEALCFVEELHPDQRAAVERHVRTCTICAQQQTSLARAAQRLHRARPRVPVPGEARLVARQAVLRSLIIRRKRRTSAFHRRVTAGRRESSRWHVFSRRSWIAVALGVGALVAVLVAALTR